MESIRTWMAAKADLLRLRLPEDMSRSQDTVLEEVFGAARRRKMSTEPVLRVRADLGATLPSPDQPQTVEETVTSLVRHAFLKPERPHCSSMHRHFVTHGFHYLVVCT